MEPLRRIHVMGNSASGKSTLGAFDRGLRIWTADAPQTTPDARSAAMAAAE